MSLVVVGTVAFDAIETPFGKTDKIIGGAATYIGLAASNFSNKIQLVSTVGDDFPTPYIESLNKRGIRTDGLQVHEGQKSFFWSGRYHNDMNSRDTLETELNVLADFNPVVPEEDRSADFVMLGNLQPSVQKSVIEQMTKRPKLIAMDTMNFWMDIAMDELKEVIGMVDILIINDEEARQLSGEYSLVTAARKIMALGCPHLIIKKVSTEHSCSTTKMKSFLLLLFPSRKYLTQLELEILLPVDSLVSWLQPTTFHSKT